METVVNESGERGKRRGSMSALGWIAFILLVIGGLNWALVGLLQLDLVAALFGGQESAASRVVYLLVGLAALYCLFAIPRQARLAREPHGTARA